MIRGLSVLIKIISNLIFCVLTFLLFYIGKIIKKILSIAFNVEEDTETHLYTTTVIVFFYYFCVGSVFIGIIELIAQLISFNILDFRDFYYVISSVQELLLRYFIYPALLLKKFVFLVQVILIEIDYENLSPFVSSLLLIYTCVFSAYACHVISYCTNVEYKNFLCLLICITSLINWKFFYTYYYNLFSIFDLYDPEYIQFKTGVEDPANFTILESELNKMEVPYKNLVLSLSLTTIAWSALYIYLDICAKKEDILDLNN